MSNRSLLFWKLSSVFIAIILGLVGEPMFEGMKSGLARPAARGRLCQTTFPSGSRPEQRAGNGVG